MNEQLTHWRKLCNPDYLGSWAFQPGEEKTLTIASVGREIITGIEGRSEECLVARFVEPVKPMILNHTNSTIITKMLQDPFIEHWPGKRIVLGVERVKAFGDVVDAIRVQKKRAEPVSTVCADCGHDIQGTDKHTPLVIASASIKRFGRALCLACVEKAKEAQNV